MPPKKTLVTAARFRQGTSRGGRKADSEAPQGAGVRQGPLPTEYPGGSPSSGPLDIDDPAIAAALESQPAPAPDLWESHPDGKDIDFSSSAAAVLRWLRPLYNDSVPWDWRLIWLPGVTREQYSRRVVYVMWMHSLGWDPEDGPLGRLVEGRMLRTLYRICAAPRWRGGLGPETAAKRAEAVKPPPLPPAPESFKTTFLGFLESLRKPSPIKREGGEPIPAPESGAETADASRKGESSSSGEGSPRAITSPAAEVSPVKTDAPGVSGAVSDEKPIPVRGVLAASGMESAAPVSRRVKEEAIRQGTAMTVTVQPAAEVATPGVSESTRAVPYSDTCSEVSAHTSSECRSEATIRTMSSHSSGAGSSPGASVHEPMDSPADVPGSASSSTFPAFWAELGRRGRRGSRAERRSRHGGRGRTPGDEARLGRSGGHPARQGENGGNASGEGCLGSRTPAGDRQQGTGTHSPSTGTPFPTRVSKLEFGRPETYSPGKCRDIGMRGETLPASQLHVYDLVAPTQESVWISARWQVEEWVSCPGCVAICQRQASAAVGSRGFWYGVATELEDGR